MTPIPVCDARLSLSQSQVQIMDGKPPTVDTDDGALLTHRSRRKTLGVDGGENPRIIGAHPLTGRFSASPAPRELDSLNEADVTRRPHVAGPCMPKESAVTAPGWDA
jgi:hypothetical protein